MHSPSAFSLRGFFVLAILSFGAYTPRRFVKKTVFPLGQFDEVKDAVRIPSGGVFFVPAPVFYDCVPAHRSWRSRAL